MAQFKEILDNLDADTMLSIFMRTLPKENNEDLRRFINTNQKVNALFSCLEEKKIKEIAEAAGVPIVENKPLARALFNLCEIGSYVPAQLYRAVAEVLAYVYRLKREKVS